MSREVALDHSSSYYEPPLSKNDQSFEVRSALVMLFLVLAMAAGCVTGASDGNDAVAARDAQFRDFIERFFNAPLPHSDTTTRIVPGGLPPDITIPLP